MKNVTLSIDLTDELKIKFVSILKNETGLPSDSKLILSVCESLVKEFNLHKDDFLVQDLLTELKIKTGE